MTLHSQFPWVTVIFNAVSLGGATLLGAALVGYWGATALVGYGLLLAAAAVGTMVTACSRCSYYGNRCATGTGLIVSRITPKRPEEEFFRTASQWVSVVGLLLLLVIAPLTAATASLLRGASAAHMAAVLAWAGLLLAGMAPHARLSCAHCRQRQRGVCRLGAIACRTAWVP